MNPDEKLCPYCAEIIKAAAIRCKQCHADLAVTSSPASSPRSPRDRVVSVEIQDLMGGLVEKSLVDFDETTGRFRLLESVRQYTRDRLAESGEADRTRAKHLDLFLAFALTAEPHLTGPDQAAWLARLDTEHDNLRAALLIPGEPALRLAGSLWRFWVMRGFLSEGRERCAELLEESVNRPASTALAAALHAAGNLAMIQSD